MVLHGGNVVVHSRVEEGQHYLLLDEGQPLHLGLWLFAGRVISHCLCALEPADLLAHEAEHGLNAPILAPCPLLIHLLAQLLMPAADDLEHQFDALGVLEDLLLDHYLQEVPAQYLDAPLDVGTRVLLQVETLDLLSTLVSHQPCLPADVVLHVGNHPFREQRLCLHIARHEFQVIHQSFPHGVLEFSRPLVAYPDVQPSSSRKDEHELGEAEVLSEGVLDDLNCDDQQLPALDAYLFARAAGPDIVVVVHIEIEDELSLQRLSVRVLLGHAVPDGPCVDLPGNGGMPVDHPLLHRLRIHKSHIALDSSALVLEGELAVSQESLVVVGEPADDGLEGIEVVIVHSQFLLCHLEGNYYYK